MKKINLKEFYLWQKELDQQILQKHSLTFSMTFRQRLLSLLIELSEFANETKCFKFWSQNKTYSRSKLIFEYIDTFHFFLSLDNYLTKHQYTYYLRKPSQDLFTHLFQTFQEVTKLINCFSFNHYRKAIRLFLELSFFYEIDLLTLKKYYLQKRKENFHRQKNNY